MLIFFSSQTDVWWQHHYKHGKKKKSISPPNRRMERKTSVTNMLPICKLWCLSFFLLHPKNLLPIQFCFHSHGNFNRNTDQRHKLRCISTYSDQEICNVMQLWEEAIGCQNLQNLTIKIVITVITKGDYLCLGRIKVDHYNVLTLFNKQKAY